MIALGKISRVKFLGYAYWLMPIIIYQMKDRSIYVDHSIHATSVVAKYLDTATFKTNKTFYNNTLPSDIIFTKADAYTSYEQVEKLTGELNIRYRACIGSLIHLLYTRVDLSFVVHNFKFVHKPW